MMGGMARLAMGRYIISEGRGRKSNFILISKAYGMVLVVDIFYCNYTDLLSQTKAVPIVGYAFSPYRPQSLNKIHYICNCELRSERMQK